MPTGICKWFHTKKGYGFITVDGEEKDVFVHYSAIKSDSNGFKTLHQGDKCSFEIKDGSKGPEAHEVVITEAAPRPQRRSSNNHRENNSDDSPFE